jgi:hypothetical protein
MSAQDYKRSSQTCFTRSRALRYLIAGKERTSAGWRCVRISGLPDSRICYGLPSCLLPCTDQTDTLGNPKHLIWVGENGGRSAWLDLE